MKLRKRFKWLSGTLEINIVDWEDGTPLGYVWFGTQKQVGQPPQYDFALSSKQAITLAENILLAAKKTP
ncbi:hypothetical protein LCGC14_2278390 [marine sediment metagenome]|uniref:Uncharacterized protein n=1 Tax=marine sediment metagenome TaxID=412755 RepID=A0A0F9CV50_9ZZZZ